MWYSTVATSLTLILPHVHICHGLLGIVPDAYICHGLLRILPDVHICHGLLRISPDVHICHGLLGILPDAHICHGLLRILPDVHICHGLLRISPDVHICHGLLRTWPDAHQCVNWAAGSIYINVTWNFEYYCCVYQWVMMSNDYNKVLNDGRGPDDGCKVTHPGYLSHIQGYWNHNYTHSLKFHNK